MKTPDQYHFQQRISVIVALVLMFGQQSNAQSYFNINFSNSTNKYLLITEVKSITFDESGGIVIKKTNNIISTETLTLLKSITLDETNGGGAPLPVELVSFTAASRMYNADLRWTTASEVNNAGFEIQRSEARGQKSENNSHAAWTRIGFVEGNGNSNTKHEYSFTNHSLTAGQYVFRLKQIDRDGKFEYSNEVEVTVAGIPGKFALEQNYPNPFNPTTEIRYQLSEFGAVQLTVFDAIGRQAATVVNEVKEAGTYSASFDGSKFSSGIYFARLTSGGQMQMRKIVLMK